MKRTLVLGSAIGVATGLLGGLMGIGGGVIAVPAMVGLLRVSQHKAHGTSLAMMVLTAAASAAVYSSRGQIDLQLALLLSVGTVMGAYLGARIMPLVPAGHLRRGFGVLLVVVAIKMIVG